MEEEKEKRNILDSAIKCLLSGSYDGRNLLIFIGWVIIWIVFGIKIIIAKIKSF